MKDVVPKKYISCNAYYKVRITSMKSSDRTLLFRELLTDQVLDDVCPLVGLLLQSVDAVLHVADLVQSNLDVLKRVKLDISACKS